MQNKATLNPTEKQKRDPRGLLFLAAMGAIFFAAAYLRLWGLEYSPTGGDQAMQLSIALRWVTQGKFPLAGHKYSVGLMSPPLTQYLLAIPLFLRRDILWVTQFVALLNVASVVASYFILRPTFGRRVALLATLLYAVNPWAVYYARLTLNLSMVPLFSTLLLGSLLAAFSRRSALHIALSFLWVAAAIQLYMPSLALIPAVGFLFWILRKKLTVRPLLIGLLLFFLSFAPFMIYELDTGFMDLGDFRQASSGEITETNLAPVAIGLELARAEGIWYTMGAAWAQWRSAAAWGESLGALVPWLILTGLIVAGWRLLRRRDEFRTRRFAPVTVGLIVIVALLGVPLLFYVRHTTYLQNYYFMYFYPLLFVIVALPADAALAWAGALPPARRRALLPLAWLPVALVVAVAGWQFYLNQVGLQLISRYARGELVTDTAAPQGSVGFAADAQQIRHVRQVIDTFADWNDRHPDCDLVIASDTYYATGSTVGQVGEFLAPRPIRYVRLGSGTIVPRACGFYLTASDNAAARAWYETHTTPLPDLTIRLPHDAWHFYDLTPPARDALVETLAASPVLGQWDNGVQLRRYTVTGGEHPGDSLGLTLTWQVYDTPPKQRYHFFNHLLDENGTLVAQADGPGVFSRYWQPGEFFVTWFDIAVPADAAPGHYRLAVGLYDWPSLERSHLTDGRDNLPLATVEITSE